MLRMVRSWRNFTIILALSLFSIVLVYLKVDGNRYLSFSDTAKSADIARNIILGFGYNGNFSFWGGSAHDLLQKASFPSPWLPPLMPFSIALAFKTFGVSDIVVMGTSAFYFILLIIFTFLLAKKLYGNIVGILSAVVTATSLDFLNYATNGSTEALFCFEITATAFLISQKKKWATVIALFLGVAMYFTRPQAFIYISGLFLYWSLITFRTKKALGVFTVVSIFALFFDYFVMSSFAGKYFLYSVTGRGIGTATSVVAGGSASDSLRGLTVESSVNMMIVFKKIFYNLYNFYKLLPQIINPYFITLFIIGLIIWSKDRFINSFKIAVIFMTAVTFLVTATSIPFFRYIHPVVPMVFIIAVGTLVQILDFGLKNYDSRKSGKLIIYLTTVFLIFLFGVGQALGVIFLDSRFVRNTHNLGKPPVYVVLSKILKENTYPDNFIVTNLDTWGSWYGERRTIWFPVKPELLLDRKTDKIPFDAIYLTSYLMNDQNYYMGDEWRQIFNNPENLDEWKCNGCSEILNNFELKGIYNINPDDNYERQYSKAVLFVRK